MEIREHTVPLHLPMAKAYVNHDSSVLALYDYAPDREDSYHERYADLQSRTLQCSRAQLVETLHLYNEEIGNHSHAREQIDRLLDPRSVVVIGGQQPGILTGPLYTIHKVMTLLTLAKREEDRLGVPVVPVFWIAGEDHDWDEVNHLFYVTGDHRLKKHALPQKVKKRASISHVELNREEVSQFIEQFFVEQLRTEHTAGLRVLVDDALQSSHSYTQFFARLIAILFGADGLILVDSADARVRALEGEMFRQLLVHNDAITAELLRTTEHVQRLGYEPQVESAHDSAHLFLYEGGVRQALVKNDGTYRLREGGKSIAEQDLLAQTKVNPAFFSCNVVTRPLMQEYLFPVLAFVAGPGEISYWGLYRQVFHSFGMRMPIIIPRMTMTIVDRPTQKFAEQQELSFEQLALQLDIQLATWLDAHSGDEVTTIVRELRDHIRHVYAPALAKIRELDATLEPLVIKNRDRVIDEVAYIEQHARQVWLRRHQGVVTQFERAKAMIAPEGKPQERVLNVFYFLNLYGMEWWQSFKNRPFMINGLHKEVRL